MPQDRDRPTTEHIVEQAVEQVRAIVANMRSVTGVTEDEVPDEELWLVFDTVAKWVGVHRMRPDRARSGCFVVRFTEFLAQPREYLP